MILIHGWGFGPEVWQRLQRSLEEQALKIPVLTPALPGYADSPAGDALESLQELVDAHDRIGLVGWSLGGLLALALAGRRPDKITRLGLIAALPRFLRGADWPAGWTPQAFAKLKRRFDRDAIAARRYVAALSAHGDADEVRSHLESASSAAKPTLASGLDLLNTADQRDAFSALDRRTDIWLGDQDALLGGDCLAAIQQLRPATRIHLLPAGHAPLVSQSHAIAESIRQEWFGTP